MNWLKRLFSGSNVQESKPKIRRGISTYDTAFSDNSDIIDGLEFAATLQLRTPSNVLQHHGELFRGRDSDKPRYGSEADGFWIIKTKTFRELGLDIDEIELGPHASDVGHVEPSQYIPFLLQFRAIVESEAPHDEQLKRLALLPNQSKQFNQFWTRHVASNPDFPLSFFYSSFTSLPGIGPQLAKRLYEAGFRTANQIVNASVAQLTAVQGLGASKAARIVALRQTKE